MLSFLQANRSSRSDDELMERAIMDTGSLVFEMRFGDAEAVVDSFQRNYENATGMLGGYQRARMFIGNLWNSSYGNLVRFIVHMGPRNVKLTIIEGSGPKGARLRVDYIPVAV